MRRDREVHRLGLRGVEDLSRDVLVDVVQVSEAESLILCWGSCWGEEERGGRGVKCRNREITAWD